MNPLLSAALAYASRGWQVIPLHWPTRGGCSCQEPKCPSPGKHPLFGKWEERATHYPNTLCDWWTRLPNANVEIAVGASGLAVLDIDGPEGIAALKELQYQHGALPPTIRFQSGGGGLHLLFHNNGYQVPCRGHIKPKLDVRGEGGMIVAPPSLHRSGRRYAVLPGPDEPAELPRWLSRLIRYTPKYNNEAKARLRRVFPLNERPKMRVVGLGDPRELAARIRSKILRER
jgi:hypothetical protein